MKKPPALLTIWVLDLHTPDLHTPEVGLLFSPAQAGTGVDETLGPRAD